MKLRKLLPQPLTEYLRYELLVYLQLLLASLPSTTTIPYSSRIRPVI